MKETLKETMKVFFKYVCLFLIGGSIYYGIEVLFRGYSYIAMACCGGMLFVLIGEFNEIYSWDTPFWKQMLFGSIVATAVEFLLGFLLLILGNPMWDYSSMPFNIMGIICLPFTIAWFFLSAVGIILDDYIRYWFFHEEKPQYNFKFK